MPSFRQLAQAPVGGRSRRHRDDPKPVLLVHPLTDSVDHDVHRRLWPTCSTSASHRNPPAPRTAGGPSTASRPHTKAFAPLEWEHAPGGPAVLQGRLGVHQEARTAREPARRPADRGPGPAGRLVEAGSHHPGGTSLSRSSWPPPAATAPALHRKVSPSRRARTDNRRRRRSRWLPCRAWSIYSPNAPDSNRWRWSTTCTTSSPATTSIRTPTGWRCSTNEDQPLAAWLGEHDTAGYRLSRKAGWDSFVNAAPRPRFEVLTRDLGLSYSPARYGLTPSRSTHGPVGGF